MLTLEQVHENNIVAKKWLSDIVQEMNKLNEKFTERKQMSFKDKFLDMMANVEEINHELALYGILREAKMYLDMYFKYHYTEAALLSKCKSPVFQYSTTKSYVLFEVEKTYSAGKVPHPINKY